MPDHKSTVREQSKRVGRELIRASKSLEEMNSLNDSLQAIYSALNEIEELASENQAIDSMFREQLKEQNLLPLFKQVESSLSKLRLSLNRLEDHSTKADVFLESYRGTRTYVFSNPKSTLYFVSESLSLFAVDNVYFKPSFVGTIDLSKLSDSLKLEKKPDLSLEVPRAKIESLVSHLMKSDKPQRFKLESTAMKINWLSPKSVQIESENPKIKRLDRLCKSLEGSY